jgi:hypothetical protein
VLREAVTRSAVDILLKVSVAAVSFSYHYLVVLPVLAQWEHLQFQQV